MYSLTGVTNVISLSAAKERWGEKPACGCAFARQASFRRELERPGSSFSRPTTRRYSDGSRVQSPHRVAGNILGGATPPAALIPSTVNWATALLDCPTIPKAPVRSVIAPILIGLVLDAAGEEPGEEPQALKSAPAEVAEAIATAAGWYSNPPAPSWPSHHKP